MELPVGYLDFHSDAIINYQINRWHSLGYCREEDLRRAGESIRSFDDYPEVFVELADEARDEGRLANAAFYYRAAEFLTRPDDDRKLELYESFRTTFEEAFEESSFERHGVPYGDGELPVLHFPAGESSKGTIVAHGGLDSFIECWHALWSHFADHGYDVYAFEGPGQGAAHRRHGLKFDHDWEKPTGAVLDYFDLEAVSLLGFSFGGYWCLRAAAFEERIAHVIAAPPLYDLLESENAFSQWMARTLMKAEGLMNWLIRVQMKMFSAADFYMRHIIDATDCETPYEAAEWVLSMNAQHLHSERIHQDVLLTVGENDAFQPPKLMELQEDALTNARSVTTRVFTADEHADQHCQVGNIGLALEVMTDWLDGLSGTNT